MAKIKIAEQDVQDLVDQVTNETGLAQIGIHFMALTTDKSKEVVQVTKANPITEIVSNQSDLVFVIINIEAWDAVDLETQVMWLRMEIDKVQYDSEKEKLTIGVPSFTIPVDFYERHPEESVKAALLAKYTLASIEQKRQEEAEAKKLAKKKKGK